MAHFTIDMAKLKEVGGGSVATFCKRNQINRPLIYQINNQRSFVDGSNAQSVAQRLLTLGIGKWVNKVEEAK